MRQKRCCCCFCFFFFFFRNGVESRRIFFFFSFLEASKGGGKKVIRVLTKGKIEGLSQRLCSSPVPPRGHGTGSIPERAGRCLPAPRGEGRTALSAECLPRPAPRRAAGRSIPPILPGCWQPEPPDTSPEPRTVPEPVHPAGDRGSPSPLPALGGDGEPGLPLRAGPGCWRSGSSFSSRSPPTCALPVGFYASVCALIIPVFVSRNAYVRDTQQYFKS